VPVRRSVSDGLSFPTRDLAARRGQLDLGATVIGGSAADDV